MYEYQNKYHQIKISKKSNADKYIKILENYFNLTFSISQDKSYTMLKQAIILLWMTPWCLSQSWSEPYFIDPGVNGVQYTGNPTTTTQTILMDEELDLNITIAIISYTGAAIPKITFFRLGSNFELGAEITKSLDDKWLVVITKFQDYEKLQYKTYRFDIEVESTVATISLDIKNLIDEDPIVTYNGPCQIKVR